MGVVVWIEDDNVEAGKDSCGGRVREGILAPATHLLLVPTRPILIFADY